MADPIFGWVRFAKLFGLGLVNLVEFHHRVMGPSEMPFHDKFEGRRPPATAQSARIWDCWCSDLGNGKCPLNHSLKESNPMMAPADHPSAGPTPASLMTVSPVLGVAQ